MDSANQVIVAADVSGSGSEQSMLLPMIEQAQPLRQTHTLVTADAGYHSNENIAALCERGIPALIADHQMRQRDERFAQQARHRAKPDVLYDKRPTGQQQSVRLYWPGDFIHDERTNSCICPAGQRLYSSGSH